MTQGQPKKLLEQVRDVLRVRRYALRTERAYCDWIRRYVKFHRMTCREDLTGGKGNVQALLTHLAVAGKVAPSTQNKALNAFSRAQYMRGCAHPQTPRQARLDCWPSLA